MARILLTVLGLAAFGGGLLSGWIGWSGRKAAERLGRLATFDHQTFATAELGREGLVEGRLAADNPPLRRDFLLYARSRLAGWKNSGGERRPVWRSVDHEFPALRLDIEGGSVRIAGSYSVTFLGSDPVWISSEQPAPGETERYEGLHAGQLVTVIGHVASDDQGRYLRADRLASGSAADTLAGERAGALFGWIASAVLLVAGTVLLALAWR